MYHSPYMSSMIFDDDDEEEEICSCENFQYLCCLLIFCVVGQSLLNTFNTQIF